MPIVGFASWEPTMREFRLHWTDVNAALAPGSLQLPPDYGLTDFADEEASVVAAIARVPDAATGARLKGAQLELVKGPMRERVSQFLQSVALNLSRSRFAGMAPRTFQQTDGQGTTDLVLQKMGEVWADIDAATDLAPFAPPLLLPGNYSLAQFRLDREALRAAFNESTGAEHAATQNRADRDALLPPMRERLRQYRLAVPLALPKNSPLLNTIPRLSPPPGTTPTALVSTGAWDSVAGRARATWTQITPQIIAKYGVTKIQVRGCTGVYKASDEEIVADLPADATSWEGDFGLTVLGAIASFKFYVMCDTGNENGGKTLKIVRPLT